MSRGVLITGAALGLGLGLAREFVRAGDRVFLSDISPAVMAAAAELGAGSHVADLSAPGAATAAGSWAAPITRIRWAPRWTAGLVGVIWRIEPSPQNSSWPSTGTAMAGNRKGRAAEAIRWRTPMVVG